ncbi:MAG: TrkH family potassium uptake protein [Prevotellaceae bacterium]|nr:TrkH family potassium uptake protein [Prevotellaceae bacterium]
MINFKLIYKILGSLLFLESLFMSICLVIAIGYNEDDILSFIFSILLTLLTAFIFRYSGNNANNNMSRRDAFLVVTLTWSVFSLFGSLPYLIGGYIPNFTNAYFETISGFTTTGATILDDVEHLPHGILFWRTFTQWIGGLGIVFFTIAILPSLVGGSVKVFAAEATGPVRTKLHPRLSTSAQSIWVVFLLITIVCTLSFKALGMNWFDSINYSMTTIATGGFSTHNDSVEFFRSPAMEYVSTFFCFLSGINFILLYRAAINREVKKLFNDSEVKFYVGIIAVFTAFIMLLLIFSNGYGIEQAFRSAIYQVVSFITTTGLFNDDAAQWPHVTWIVLAICMFIGGCAGSTSGGFKSIRCLMLLKIVSNEFKQMLHPKAVLQLKVGSNNISMQNRVTLLAFLTTYILLFVFCAFAMTGMGVDNTNAITITLSTLGNVGPTLGTEIGPTMSWNELPVLAKWICSLLMLMGRLELLSVLVIFTPQFWKE